MKELLFANVLVTLQSTMHDDIIQNTLDALRSGECILYPTDTVWGIGCDASDSAAVEKIYAIKRRDHAKSMLILADAQTFRTGIEAIDRLLHDSERPTTVIMPASSLPCGFHIAENLLAADGTIGIRIPRHTFCQSVIRILGKPIVSTSANLSGQPTPATYGEIDEALKASVDYCVPDLPEFAGCSQPSRILKVSATGDVITIRS